RVTYAELSLEVVNDTSASKVKFVAIDRYPSISRDIALVVDREVTAEEMLKIINSTGKKLVRKSEVFDIYEGEHVEAGKKSVALRITYQASDHTLNDEEVRTVHDAILEKLKEKLSADLRS
ncbi:MAG: phenylalanine--tRNA ligase subunit beta, partial [Solobacterium sp.]|nr:phenylalanine--tRNA ligase subunit beta [Solobacterium sp.]